MAAKDNDDQKSEEQDAEISLDLSQAAVKKMIAEARERGFITYDQLNRVLPPDQVNSEQIEDVMSMLSEMGINVIEAEEADDDDAAPAAEEPERSTSRELATTTANNENLDRTDDPVRMYLREMGSVELLSRKGGVAIAKRIEAGRNTMISGLCESPLTFQAITIWRDELMEELIVLRDVIDLETTFGNQMGEEEADTPVVAPVAGGEEKKEETQELDADGNPITEAELGRPITVRLQLRSLGKLPVTNAAIMDLLPGGFEVDRQSLPAGRSKLPGIAFNDVREDRVVLFGTIPTKVQTLTYQINPTRKGTFVIPPIYADSMYDRSVRGYGVPGQIVVR